MVKEITIEGLGKVQKVGELNYVLILTQSDSSQLPADETKRKEAISAKLEQEQQAYELQFDQLREDYIAAATELERRYKKNLADNRAQQGIVTGARLDNLEIRVEGEE